MITIDFESHPIQGNTSAAPPLPVGVAIKQGNKPGKYYGWGHPTGNNSTYTQARAALAAVWCKPLLFHNAKFDVSLAIQHMGLPMPNWNHINDTVYMLFLSDPYSANLSLKPNAERMLGLPPVERDELAAWVLGNTPCTNPREVGAWIWAAPGSLVGKYCVGDVERTKGLYDLLLPRLKTLNVLEAYAREQRLMPITYYSEVKGVRVDVERLQADVHKYEKALLKCEQMLLKKLKRDSLDFGKAAQVADALEAAGLIGQWQYTPTGKRSTSKDNLEKAVKDEYVLGALRYRGALASCLQTFARPWAQLCQLDGRIHTSWNQVRTHDGDGGDSRGARTGRLSASKPSLMNVTNELNIDVPKGLPAPPLMRQYLLPEEGHVWVKRDFSSQEVRWLAHFEDGGLLQAYQEDPHLDPHTMGQELVGKIVGVQYPRKDIKITAFSIVYGAGVNSLSQQLGRPAHEASLIKDAYLRALPGIKTLQKSVSQRGRDGLTVRTWGGREYRSEPSKLVHGRLMDFHYKLLNYLIQGSAADQTKQCLCDWYYDMKQKDDVFLATVHDEINISAPADTWKESMGALRKSMDQPISDCPMRSEGFMGLNWFDTEKQHGT